LIYASTSSVYGLSNQFPLKEESNTDKPLSFYAATKKSNEVMAHAYSNIYKLPCTGLRFFTVYGQLGRPDMSLFKFTKAIIEGNKVDLYNYGDHVRDFTHVDDVVVSIIKLINKIPKGPIPFEIFNIGSNRPKPLKEFLKQIEMSLSKKAKIKLLPMQKGDVHKTHASTKKLNQRIKFVPKVQIKEGIKKFVDWYISYYKK
jgi:UDP-glucuronate 4-epimerase